MPQTNLRYVQQSAFPAFALFCTILQIDQNQAIIFSAQDTNGSLLWNTLQSGLGSRKIFYRLRLRLLTFFYLLAGLRSRLIILAAPASDFFSKRLRLRLLVLFSSGSGIGSKEPKTPGSDRLRLPSLAYKIKKYNAQCVPRKGFESADSVQRDR